MSEAPASPQRKVIHIDMDAFYASVEQYDRPELSGKPVVVGGRPESRGVVAAASYEARRFGIRSAMSSRTALNLCPQLVFLPPRFERYHEVSEQIRAIFHEITHLVEPLSLDEAYLDVTTNLLNEPLAGKIAALIKARIKAKTGLTASAGVGPNKFIAKIASDFQKPDGLVIIPPQKVDAFVRTLPVEKLWGVGPATAKKLESLGIRTAEDLRHHSVGSLEGTLGKFAHFLRDLAFGIDPRPVETDQEPRSRGSETTFNRDILNAGQLVEELGPLAEDVGQSLEAHQLEGYTVTVKIRYNDFETITRSRTWPKPVGNRKILAERAEVLLFQSTEVGERPVRLLGVSVSNFVVPGQPMQLWLDLPDGDHYR